MKRRITCLLIVLASIFMISCNFQKLETESYSYNNEASLKRINTNIKEAKVLSDIAVINENIISLSQMSEEISESYSIKTISSQLKKDHLKTKKDINHLAEKKLILLPNSIDKKKINDIAKTTNDSISNDHLMGISKLLKIEIAQLEYLSSITNDVDFKVLGAKTLVSLEYNYNQIHNIIKTNY